jgi:hypothetical protein
MRLLNRNLSRIAIKLGRRALALCPCLLALLVFSQIVACSGGTTASGTLNVTQMYPGQLTTGGGQVAFTGSNLTADTKVSFGGVAASNVYFQSSAILTAVSPSVSAPGSVDVTISNSSGTVTLKQALKYVTPTQTTGSTCASLPCTYKAYDPSNTLVGGAQISSCAGCPDGQKVGSLGFGNFVIINNVYAPADGTYTLTITGCEGGGTQNYKVITNGGTPLTVPLSGNNWFAPASPVTVTIPLKAGSSNTVELGNDTDWSPDVVNIQISSLQSGPPITVTSLTPNQTALPGGTVVFAGTNFTPDIKVSFGGVDAGAISYGSATTFSATAPAATAAGAVDVVVTSPTGGIVTLAKGFTYLQSQPLCGALPCTYLAYDPANTLTGGAHIDTGCTHCPNGTKVGGLGFGAYVTINNVFAPANGQYQLSISGVEGGGTQNYKISVNGGTPYVVPLTGSDWYTPAAPVLITIPLSNGHANTIKIGNDTDWSPDLVSVTVSPVNAATLPSITSISPTSASITGGKVTVTGTNFTPNTTISFGGIAAGPITYTSATSFMVNAPPSPTTGAVDVTVNASINGTSTSKGAFTYTELQTCSSSTCTYQAWDPANTLVQNGKTATCVGCQYGLKVGNLGYGSAVTINNVYAPADGNYVVSLVACEGGGTQTAMISANGGTAMPVNVTGNNWYLQTQPIATVVALKAGSSNKITIGNTNNYSPDVVSITVSPGATSSAGSGQTVAMYANGGNSQVTYDLTTGLATYSYASVDKVKNFYSAGYSGATLYKSTSASYTRTANIGSNGEYDITLTATDGSPTMIQRFFLNEKHFLVQVELDGQAISSNEMSPIVMDTAGGVDLGTYADPRFLEVPYDNDSFVSYNAASANGTSTTGFEVGAYYDNTSRNGLVVGAVTHDSWKTAVAVTGNNNKLDYLWAYGGANDPWDKLPHGAVTGNKVLSPTVLMGYYPDWRDGMEDFAAANAAIAPKLAWNAPAPMGWAFLGEHDSKISATIMTQVADYFHTSLPSFSDQGVQYINMDAYWNNLSVSDLQALVQHVHAQGQKAGIYWTPWVVWNWNNTTDNLDGVSGYKVNDVIMKRADGTPMDAVDSAYAVDPTSAGARARIDAYTVEFKTAGFDYIKLDFLSHGAMEGGANNGIHADPTIFTGQQAYNQGMAYVYSKIGNTMLIDESIAPIFPYQYAHARRISCDTFGSISNSAYEMNSESYGWWLAGTLYNWNDPDAIRLVLDNPTSTEPAWTPMENKTNVTAKAVGGYMLSGDDVTISTTDSLVQQWMANASINGLPALNLHFRPVEGNTGTSPVNLMIAAGPTVGTYYLAVFNFDGSKPATPAIDLGRAGLNSTASYTATDLWSNSSSTVTGTMSVSLQPAEGTIIKLIAK